MRQRSWSGLLLPLLLATAPLARAGETAAPKTAPLVRPDLGFTATFPAPPTPSTAKSSGADFTFFQLLDDRVVYQVLVATSSAVLDAPQELKDAVNGVADSMKGRLVVTESVKHAADDGRKLPAIAYVAENNDTVMVGRFIVDGKRMFGYAVAVVRGFDRHLAAEAFIRSFRLTPLKNK